MFMRYAENVEVRVAVYAENVKFVAVYAENVKVCFSLCGERQSLC